MGEAEGYFDYLTQRSILGYAYRKYFLYPRLVKYLEKPVLDYGCGIGDFLHCYPETIGVDINRQTVAHCLARGGKVHFLEKGNVLPFPDNFFSGIVIDNVLEHISLQKVVIVISELVRVLRVGGRIVAGVPGSRGYQNDPDHKVAYSRADLIALFEHAGLVLEDSFYMPLNTPIPDKYLSAHCLYAVFRYDR